MQKLFEYVQHIGDWRVLVQTRDLAPGVVVNQNIAVNAIEEYNIVDGAVTTPKIADKAVTPSKASDDFVDVLVKPYLDAIEQEIAELRGSIPPKDVLYRCFVYQSRGGVIAAGETETEEVKVFWGGEDVTERFTQISVTRDTGDSVSDEAWNARHTSVSNPFIISFDDLRIDNERSRTDFTVTAVDNEENRAQRVLTFE